MKNKKLLLLCVGLLMTTQMIFAQVPSYVPTNGLVGYWPFNGNANDQSGNGNNGTINGATLTSDRFGNSNSAYNFDGQSYIRVSHNPNFNFGISDYSISVWANKTGSSWLHSLITKATPHPATGWAFGFVNSDIRFLAGVQNSNFLSNGSVTFGPINNSEWNNFVAVFNPTMNSIKIYKNGQIVVSELVTTSLINCDNIYDLMFGVANPNGAPSGPEFFQGDIDDIGIWNRALTPQEITNLYNANQCINTITVTDTLIINVGQLSFTNPVTYANNITIYPNPASTQVNISFNNITDLTGGSIKIMNSLGQQVATTPITATGTNTTMALNSWGDIGLYFVQIVNAQGQIVDIKKIILQ